MKKLHLPFQEMTHEKWLNLALVGILALYTVRFGYYLFNGEMCNNLAFDYCAYWSEGKIINDFGIEAIYNLDIMKKVQRNVYLQGTSINIDFFVNPVKGVGKIV